MFGTSRSGAWRGLREERPGRMPKAAVWLAGILGSWLLVTVLLVLAVRALA